MDPALNAHSAIAVAADVQMACSLARYTPSPWELIWRQRVTSQADPTPSWSHWCPHLKNESAHVQAWVSLWEQRAALSGPTDPAVSQSWDSAIFSYHTTCAGRRVPIEPLVGFLRHPRHVCFNKVSYKYAKGYLVLPWSWEADTRPGRRRFLFDMGASLYRAGLGGASMQVSDVSPGRGCPRPETRERDTRMRPDLLCRDSAAGRDTAMLFCAAIAPRADAPLRRQRAAPDTLHSLLCSGSACLARAQWFWQSFEARGIVFDRVLAWEAHNMSAHNILASFPPHVMDVVSYYNVPVDPTPNARFNPWRTLRQVATPADYVVVKIDIDNTPIERALVEQLLADRGLSSLVDEFFHEHHVRDSPMMHQGWAPHSAPRADRPMQTLAQSYELFSRLRQLGIRAHSWV